MLPVSVELNSTLTCQVTNDTTMNTQGPWVVLTATKGTTGYIAGRFTFAVEDRPEGATRTATLTLAPNSRRELDALQNGSIQLTVQVNSCIPAETMLVSLRR